MSTTNKSTDSAKDPDPRSSDPKPGDPKSSDPKPTDVPVSDPHDDVPDAPDGVGESTDPDVQKLLAEREIAVSNRRGLDVDADQVKSADQAIKDIDDKLAELGYK